MAKRSAFYCLRCQHRFDLEYDPKRVTERTCPGCGSNSVRLAPTKPSRKATGVAVAAERGAAS